MKEPNMIEVFLNPIPYVIAPNLLLFLVNQSIKLPPTRGPKNSENWLSKLKRPVI